MTKKHTLRLVGYDSLNNNTSGNPDTDRDLGIAQPEEFLSLIEQMAEKPKTRSRAKSRHPSAVPHPKAYNRGKVRGDSEFDGGAVPTGHEEFAAPTDEEREIGIRAVQLAREMTKEIDQGDQE